MIAGVLFIICESFRENRTFRVSRYHVKTSNALRGLRIVFLSDLHNRCFGVHNEKLIQGIDNQAPDVILIGGDMLIGRSSKECFHESIRLIRALASKYPVFYANGNHEQRMKEDVGLYDDMFERYMNELKGLNIHFLSNETKTILIKGQTLSVTGLEIDYKCYTKGKNLVPFSINDMKKCVGENKEKSYHILLAHNPMYMDTYKQWEPNMILSGHLHGGAVRIPGVGGVISPQMRLFPKYSGGRTTENDIDIIVSRGLGSHSIPLRIFNIPELVTIQLHE